MAGGPAPGGSPSDLAARAQATAGAGGISAETLTGDQ